MNIIEATYIINTKMFLGSANNELAEIRPPSFKGILRFWFRALALAELGGDKGEVERLEGILFGTTSGKSAQKALYSLKIEKNNIPNSEKGNRENKSGIIYLGYGLKGRDFIGQNNKIKVLLIKNLGIKRKINKRDLEIGKKLLLNSLKAIGIFGGLGSRARKGFGSLTLVDLKDNKQTLINSPYCGKGGELKKEINKLLEKAKKYGDNPYKIPYTAFSKFTKIIITKEFNSAVEALDEIGKEMIRYRSYGINGKVLGEESEKIFQDDHDLVYDFVKNKYIDKHPQRIVFGLPHNYRLSTRDTVNVSSFNINKKNLTRRSSPLFIHIHKLENEKYIGILTLIPAKFLKDEYKIRMFQKEKKLKDFETDISYEVIEDFLDRIVNNMAGTEII